MFSKYYSNVISQTTKGFAKGFFIIGLLLIGFGVLVYVLKEVFAAIAAAIFIIAGAGCCVTGIKTFLQSRKFRHTVDSDTEAYRENVQIHTKEHDEF